MVLDVLGCDGMGLDVMGPPGREAGDAPINEADNCKKMDCPIHCQYPFTKEVYNDDDHPKEHYDHLGNVVAYNFLRSNPEAYESYLSNATNPEMIKEEFKEYNEGAYPGDLNLQCGRLIKPEGTDTYKFPNLPSQEELKQSINYNINYLERGIDWTKVKNTEKLKERYPDQIDETNNTFCRLSTLILIELLLMNIQSLYPIMVFN